MGVDATRLQASVQGFNDWYEGAPDEFRTSSVGAPLQTPPFHSVEVSVSVAKGFGGVDVDLDGRVLNAAGGPIPGLYAGGELTGMIGGSIVGEYGFTGSLTAVVLGGRVAGAHAAAEALGE
jgi:predicted oxidoreductase